MENQTILLTEDSELMLKIYKTKLENEGFKVETAKDGQEAIDMLKGGLKVDFILLDVMMPRKNGFEVLEWLRGNKATQNIPVILLSGLTSEEDINKGLEMGAIDFISKKNIQDIITRTKEILSSYNNFQKKDSTD